jgi:hypothetical protein
MANIRFKSSSSSDQPTGCLAKIGVSLFFLVFAAMGSFFMYLIGAEVLKIAQTYTWPQTPCVIQTSEDADSGDDEDPYAFTVTYTYDYEGQTHTSSAFRRDIKNFSDFADVQTFLNRYPPGAESNCYVNPDDPDEAILQRSSLWFALFAMIPAVFMLVGFGGIFMTWRGGDDESNKKNAPKKSISSKASGKSSTLIPVAFISLFIVIAIGIFFAFFLLPTFRVITAKDWPAVTCVIEKSDTRVSRGEDSTSYYPDILYSYTIDGRTYKSNRHSFYRGSGDSDDARAVTSQYPRGQNATCYVDPQNPASATLNRDFHLEWFAILFPAFFGGIPCVILYAILKANRSQNNTRSMTTGKTIATTPTSSAIPSTPTGYRGDQRPDSRDPYDPTSTPGSTGPIVLKPKTSRITKLVAIIVFALFWNGIVSVFLIEILDSFRSGDIDWFGVLFFIPFGLVGLTLIAAIVYFILALTNPRIQLTVNASTIQLGDPLDVAWDVIGNAKKFSQLTITLEAREEATYQRGTTTVTDKETFHKLTLIDTDETNAIHANAASLTLPLDTMHSFEADNNKIIWELKVHGHIPRWPDVKTDYAIIALPANPTE